MSANASHWAQHTAYIGLGSNINPDENIRAARLELRARLNVVCESAAWRSPSIGTPGPEFLNAVVKVETELDAEALKLQVLRPLESELGRQRGPDKNAPRTIDLDVLVFDDDVLDEHIWDYPHLAIPLAECAPDLAKAGRPLADIAEELQTKAGIQRAELGKEK